MDTPAGVRAGCIALLSDVHANLPALEAVLADIARRGDVAARYHLGDLVGYAPWPDAVVQRLRSEGIEGVAGNYDSTVGTNYKHCGCRYEDARQEELSHISFAWTKARCTDETKQYLARLPFRLDLRPLGGHRAGPTVALVHASPTMNTLYWTEDRSDDFCRQMIAHAGVRAGDAIAFGHTHKPWTREVDGVRLINTGSVGRSKDGDWRACYVLLEYSGTGLGVQVVRLPYDVERAAQAIAPAGLPEEFAHYLRSGGASTNPPATLSAQ